jgi:hypothetical protein
MFEYPSNCGLTATGPATWNFIGVVGESGCGTVGTAEAIGFKDRGSTVVGIGMLGRLSIAGAAGITGGAIGAPTMRAGDRGIAACIN